MDEGLRVWAEVDLDRLGSNVRKLRERAGGAGFVAVVKANAYGHGAVAVARRVLREGAWGLAVIGVDEGEELRRAGIAAPVIVLGYSAPALAERLVAADLRPTVSTLALGEALAAAATRAGKTVPVHIKVETGLNRSGVTPDEAVALAEALRSLPGLSVEGLFTHFAAAEDPDRSFVHQQYAAFQACFEQLAWVPLRHAANSAALLALPELALDLVRVGVALYGHYPAPALRDCVHLDPVLALKSRVARVRQLAPGETAGYGRTWRADRPSTVALVMAGYGDGVRRALSNNAYALVRGQRVLYAGRVAMDMTILDITDVPGVVEGDEVVLFGSQGAASVTVEELAERCGTIAYEILTGVTARVPRLFVEGGRIVARQDLAGYRDEPAAPNDAAC